MELVSSVVLLITRLGWRTVLLLDADPQEGFAEALSAAGVPAAVVSASGLDRYPWPGPHTDGSLLTVTEKTMPTIVDRLRAFSMISPFRSWLVVSRECLNPPLEPFQEGDRVLLLHCTHQIPFLWSLHSPGNGSLYFLEKSSNSTVLFDTPLSDFGGRELRISALGSPPIVIPPPPGKSRWHGYIFEIVNTLARDCNFSYVVKEAEKRLYGMLQEDGTWSGMIGELVNKSVDMGVGDLSWTQERSEAVDLTYSVFPETVTFIFQAPGFSSRTWILFEDFDSRIWIGLSWTLLIVWSTYCFILYVAVNDKTHFVEASVRSLGDVGKALVGQGINSIPPLTSARIALGTWFLGAFVVGALYGGGLTSALSMRRTDTPSDTLRHLVTKHPDVMLAVRNNSQIHAHMKRSSLYRKRKMEAHVIPGRVHISDTIQKVRSNPIYVWIAERSMLEKQMYSFPGEGDVCELYVAKEDIVRSDWSIALVPNSPYLTRFNNRIARLEQFGLLQRWKTQYWVRKRANCRPTDGQNPADTSALSLNDTQAAFLVLAIGWTIAIFMLVIETTLFNGFQGTESEHYSKQCFKKKQISNEKTTKDNLKQQSDHNFK